METQRKFHFQEHVFLPKTGGIKCNVEKFDQHMVLSEIGMKLVVSKEEPETANIATTRRTLK